MKLENIKKMVLIVDEYPFPIGGMETHAYEFIKFFSQQNAVNFIGVIAFSSTLKNIKYVTNERNISLVIFPKNEIYDGKNLLTELIKIKIGPGDIVFFNSLYWIRTFFLLRSKFPDSNLILRSGGNDIAQSGIIGAGKTLKERQSFVINIINKNINFLIVNSKYSFNMLKGFGVHGKIMVISSGGVDTDRFTPTSEEEKRLIRGKLNLPNKKIILSVCRIVPWKGLEYTIESISKINSDSICYVIVGTGPHLVAIQEKISELNLQKKVFIRDSLPINKIHLYFKIAYIYCHTPTNYVTKVEGGSYIHTETMGRSFCEAMSCGVPVVATDIGGLKNIVLNGLTGFLAKEKDVNQISSFILTLIENKKKYEKMSQYARIYALKNFSWKNTIFKNYFNIFNI